VHVCLCYVARFVTVQEVLFFMVVPSMGSCWNYRGRGICHTNLMRQSLWTTSFIILFTGACHFTVNVNKKWTAPTFRTSQIQKATIGLSPKNSLFYLWVCHVTQFVWWFCLSNTTICTFSFLFLFYFAVWLFTTYFLQRSSIDSHIIWSLNHESAAL